jgi:hypothetical protein
VGVCPRGPKQKGFSYKMDVANYVHSTGGRVCININGDRTSYFRTFQGLRQGDPLSPVLFNLDVDTLSTLTTRAAEMGLIKRVMSHLVHEGISHIQYADDTILMVEGDDNSIAHMKFILYCFEWMPGLKINYHKSEAFTFGTEEEDSWRVANMLNCQLGQLPMKYFGIPLNNLNLGTSGFAGVVDKVAKKIPPWKGKNSSSGGRLILSNGYLASLPIYTMGFYLLPKGSHKKMDSIRSRFFWRGARDDFKYHMVKWSAVCRPKQFGG